MLEPSPSPSSPEPAAGLFPRQLRLLPASSPLTERFGAGFFRALPARPGVYFMRDAQGRLLYVGKATSLRQRLNAYRYPAQADRKTMRLIHRVRAIEWELCATERDAHLRENALLRLHRPRFNRLGTWPQAYRFIRLHRSPEGFLLELTAPGTGDKPNRHEPCFAFAASPVPLLSASATEWFGSFKGPAARAFVILLRRLWLAMHPDRAFEALPRTLLLSRPPRTFHFAGRAACRWLEPLQQFLGGLSATLLEGLLALTPAGSPFDQLLHQADCELLDRFFQTGPKRNRLLCQQLGRAGCLIQPEELDDLLVLAAGAEGRGADGVSRPAPTEEEIDSPIGSFSPQNKP